jgi:hypothetical protein
MAIAASDFPQSINRGDLQITYEEGIRAVTDRQWEVLIQVEETPANSKNVVFYGDVPKMRRLRGEKQPQKFEEYKMNMFTDIWEVTFDWKIDEMRREQDPGKIIRRKVLNHAQNVEKTKQNQMWLFLRSGVSIIGFDKEEFYGTAHRYVDSKGVTNTAVSAQSNVHWGGSQLDATTLQLEEQHYAELRTDKNDDWGLVLSHVLVKQGSANHKTARELANSQFTVEVSTVKGANTTNIFQGAFEILTTRDVNWGASEWASFALNDPNLKPVYVLSETNNSGWGNEEFETVGLEEMSTDRFWRGKVASSTMGYWDFNPGYWMTTRLHGSSAWSYTPADYEDQRYLYPNLN